MTLTRAIEQMRVERDWTPRTIRSYRASGNWLNEREYRVVPGFDAAAEADRALAEAAFPEVRATLAAERRVSR